MIITLHPPFTLSPPPLTFWIRGWTGDGVFGVGCVSGGDWGLLSCTCFVFRSIWLQLFISANNLCSVISSISSKIQTRVMQQFSDKQTQTVCTETLGFINFFKVVKVTIVPPFPDHSTSPVLALGNFLFFCETHVSVGKFIRWNYWKINKWTLSVLCLSPYHPFFISIHAFVTIVTIDIYTVLKYRLIAYRSAFRFPRSANAFICIKN